MLKYNSVSKFDFLISFPFVPSWIPGHWLWISSYTHPPFIDFFPLHFLPSACRTPPPISSLPFHSWSKESEMLTEESWHYLDVQDQTMCWICVRHASWLTCHTLKYGVVSSLVLVWSALLNIAALLHSQMVKLQELNSSCKYLVLHL